MPFYACAMPRTARPPQDRFWAMVKKGAGDACWLWAGNVGTHGYGQISLVSNRVQTTHRFSWEIHNGSIEKGVCVLHKCDVKRCVRPDHLFLGDHSDNLKDSYNKNRKVKIRLPGTTNPSHVLTENQVREIRALQHIVTQQSLADRMGVSRQTIKVIQGRKGWRHLK